MKCIDCNENKEIITPIGKMYYHFDKEGRCPACSIEAKIIKNNAKR